MKRVAIILEKNLTAGQTANISGILMGQAAMLTSGLYDFWPVSDHDGQQHAAIRYSTVVLAAGSGQLLALCKNATGNNLQVLCIAFSQIGQGLHNRFDEYKCLINNATTEETKLVGVILTGGDEEVRSITKKFSLFR